MKTLIKNGTIVNEGLKFRGDVLIQDNKISKVFPHAVPLHFDLGETKIVDATGLLLIPGVIDTHVHFREPGFTHKGEILSEGRAAIAGGITSYMEMPNTSPQTVTQELLEQKYLRAASVSAANYSFYLGATNNNIEEVLKTDSSKVCGIKVFMGSSTGNMLVDDENTLSEIFEKWRWLLEYCKEKKLLSSNDAISVLCETFFSSDMKGVLEAHKNLVHQLRHR